MTRQRRSGSRPAGLTNLLPIARLEAFSDGVFAIAITLLVLNLKVPDAPERLLGQLADEWPALLGYLVSFAFIGGSWVAHASLTHLLRATDGVFLGLNLMLLLFVSLLPFTTDLLTKHLTDAGQRVAVVTFGINLTLAVLVASTLVSYAARADGLTHQADRVELAWLERERWLGTGLLALSTALSAVVPAVAAIFYLVVSTLLISQPIRRLHRWGRTRRRRAEAGSAK